MTVDEKFQIDQLFKQYKTKMATVIFYIIFYKVSKRELKWEKFVHAGDFRLARERRGKISGAFCIDCEG